MNQTTIRTDRLVMSYVLTGKHGDKQEHDRVCNFINSDCKKKIIEGAKFWKTKKAPWSYGSVPIGYGNKLVIGFGYANKNMRASFQFNPSKITPPEFCALHGHFEMLLHFGFHSLCAKGRVRDCEIAIDVDHAKFSDYWFVDTRMAASDCGYQPVGTLYLGALQSRRQLRIYDKAKQMHEKLGIELPNERLRIEAQLRPVAHYAVAELPTIPNPFESLFVISKSALSAKANNELVAAFLALASTPGISSQKAYTASTDRKALRQLLIACCPDWWKPSEIWSTYSESFDWVPPPHPAFANVASEIKVGQACVA